MQRALEETGAAAVASGTENHVVAGRYELLGPLGEGGVGVVYRAHDRVEDRVVALKQLLSKTAGALRPSARVARRRAPLQAARPAWGWSKRR